MTVTIYFDDDIHVFGQRRTVGRDDRAAHALILFMPHDADTRVGVVCFDVIAAVVWASVVYRVDARDLWADARNDAHDVLSYFVAGNGNSDAHSWMNLKCQKLTRRLP